MRIACVRAYVRVRACACVRAYSVCAWACVRACIQRACVGVRACMRQGLEKPVLFFQRKLSSIGPTLSKVTATLSLFAGADCANNGPGLFSDTSPRRFQGQFGAPRPRPRGGLRPPAGTSRKDGTASCLLCVGSGGGRLPLRAVAISADARDKLTGEHTGVRWPASVLAPTPAGKASGGLARISCPVTSGSGAWLAPELPPGPQVTQQPPFISASERVASSAGWTC